MQSKQDVESCTTYNDLDIVEPERELLLPSHSRSSDLPIAPTPQYTLAHLVYAFLGGVALCIGARFLLDISTVADPSSHREITVQAPPYVGSTEVDHFPPTSPTNAFPDLFPTKYALFNPTVLV